jgi:phosphoribosylformylglycinamidine synthase
VRALIRDGIVTAVHDISDGGLLVALAEMAMVSHIGAVLEAAR